MKVVIIGSGNVATVLGKMIHHAGHAIVQVYGRNAGSVANVAGILSAEAVVDATAIDATADIYLIAVSDNAIQAVAKQLSLNNKIVVHTSGAASKRILEGCTANYGVLYPLQSIRKEKLHTPAVPFLVDGANDYTLELLKTFAAGFSPYVSVADDEQRLRLHIAAVFVSNFTNHLYAVTHDYCDKEAVPFNMLVPLIQETALRLSDFPARAVQTGPAIRNDNDTINRHLHELENYPEMKILYKLFTESIKGTYLK